MWYISAKEYYSAIRRNTLETVLMRWMNLESIIHSEVSQKVKNKYHILTHIYGCRKMVLVNLFAGSNGDADIETDLWTQWVGKERVR